jgi:hypothetical protein
MSDQVLCAQNVSAVVRLRVVSRTLLQTLHCLLKICHVAGIDTTNNLSFSVKDDNGRCLTYTKFSKQVSRLIKRQRKGNLITISILLKICGHRTETRCHLQPARPATVRKCCYLFTCCPTICRDCRTRRSEVRLTPRRHEYQYRRTFKSRVRQLKTAAVECMNNRDWNFVSDAKVSSTICFAGRRHPCIDLMIAGNRSSRR